MNVLALFDELSKRYRFSFRSLKAEQQSVIALSLSRKNVFAFYPTGFGKSLMYVLPPLMNDLVRIILFILGLYLCMF